MVIMNFLDKTKDFIKSKIKDIYEKKFKGIKDSLDNEMHNFESNVQKTFSKTMLNTKNSDEQIINSPSKNIYQPPINRDNLFRKRKIEEFEKELSAIPIADFIPNGEKLKKRRASDIGDIEFTNITKRTNIDKLFPFVVIDTETTGIKLSGNNIIEISAIKIDKGFTPISCFTTLINIDKDLPDEITYLTGISKDMLNDKP